MTARARSFSYDVSLDRSWEARSALGGDGIPNDEDAWTPEHLVLAGLCRCVLTSFRYHARRASLEAVSSGSARGVVTRREEDGRFAFVEIEARLELAVDAGADAELVRTLTTKAERDCFVGASLTVKPAYHWIVNGEELR